MKRIKTKLQKRQALKHGCRILGVLSCFALGMEANLCVLSINGIGKCVCVYVWDYNWPETGNVYTVSLLFWQSLWSGYLLFVFVLCETIVRKSSAPATRICYFFPSVFRIFFSRVVTVVVCWTSKLMCLN